MLKCAIKIKNGKPYICCKPSKISTHPGGRRCRRLSMIPQQFKRLSRLLLRCPVRCAARRCVCRQPCASRRGMTRSCFIFYFYFHFFYVEIFSKIHHARKWKNVITSRWLMVLRESANEPGPDNHYGWWLHCRTAHASATAAMGFNETPRYATT